MLPFFKVSHKVPHCTTHMHLRIASRWHAFLANCLKSLLASCTSCSLCTIMLLAVCMSGYVGGSFIQYSRCSHHIYSCATCLLRLLFTLSADLSPRPIALQGKVPVGMGNRQHQEQQQVVDWKPQGMVKTPKVLQPDPSTQQALSLSICVPSNYSYDIYVVSTHTKTEDPSTRWQYSAKSFLARLPIYFVCICVFVVHFFVDGI